MKMPASANPSMFSRDIAGCTFEEEVGIPAIVDRRDEARNFLGIGYR
jgi:hypothetical protein